MQLETLITHNLSDDEALSLCPDPLGVPFACCKLLETEEQSVRFKEEEEKRSKAIGAMALNMNEADIFGDEGTDELAGMSVEDIQRRSRLMDNEIRVLKVFFSFCFLHSDFACWWPVLWFANM